MYVQCTRVRGTLKDPGLAKGLVSIFWGSALEYGCCSIHTCCGGGQCTGCYRWRGCGKRGVGFSHHVHIGGREDTLVVPVLAFVPVLIHPTQQDNHVTLKESNIAAYSIQSTQRRLKYNL